MKLSKDQFLDFIILSLRWYLAYYMVSYGWSKMTGGQFGAHDPAILEQPLQEVDRFYIAWYLFSLSPAFNYIVGFFQILGGILIVINRTALVGALMLLPVPVLGQIFLIDVAFTTTMFGMALPVRLGGMILSDILIMIYYRDKMLAVWKILTKNTTTKFSYSWWMYPILLLIGLLTDFVLAILLAPVKLLLNWLMCC